LRQIIIGIQVINAETVNNN